MTPNENGRHCSSCNKTVVDFSNYTDRELADFFRKANTNICGRITEYQADRTILLTQQPNRSFLHKLFFGTALASWFGMAGTTVAQEKYTPKAVTQPGRKTTGVIAQRPDNTGSCTLKGMVTDKHHLGIEEVDITITLPGNDSAIATTRTDSSGHYSVSIPKQYYKQALSISFYCPGYKDADSKFTVKEASSLNMELIAVTKRRPSHVMGKF